MNKQKQREGERKGQNKEEKKKMENRIRKMKGRKVDEARV